MVKDLFVGDELDAKIHELVTWVKEAPGLTPPP